MKRARFDRARFFCFLAEDWRRWNGERDLVNFYQLSFPIVRTTPILSRVGMV